MLSLTIEFGQWLSLLLSKMEHVAGLTFKYEDRE